MTGIWHKQIFLCFQFQITEFSISIRDRFRNLVEIKKEIIALLTEPATLNDIVNGDDDKKSVAFRNVNEIIDDANNRESSELTDQLWTVLRGCSSYEMLKEAIEYIFNSAAKINVVVRINSSHTISYK